MTALQEFEESLTNTQPPKHSSVYLQSLWYDAKGDWDKAHSLIDHISDKTAYRVHAYLHRVEGDKWNANYWYTKAGERMPDVSLKEEWNALVQRLIARG
jgi:hypothetical protein